MLFNSIDFLIFYPIVVVIYFVVPRKTRYIWLLLASYYFYMGWNPKYAILIALSTIITYVSSILIERSQNAGNNTLKNIWLAGSLVSNLGILFIFKYSNFFLHNLSAIVSRLGFSIIDKRLDFLLPVGISFYTFQALSYTFDVYRGEIKAERNILKYALFVSFFPQLVAGPIERSTSLLPQIQNVHKINVWQYEKIRNGLLLMMWGLFQKLVIADRASILVDNVISNYANYGFVELSLAIILFAVQVYCDFGGYSNIARGAAKVMGFELMNNFAQPYLATNIKDFWRRWHISLTSWLTDYVYIPLGGNRKGRVKKYINILTVFGISGLWHGASWSFVVWGLLHAFYQVIGDLKNTVFSKIVNKNENKNTISFRLRKIIGTFILTDFAWIFFVSDGIHQALGIIKNMLTCVQTTDIFELGLDRGNWFFLIMGIAILLFVDVMHEKGNSIFELIQKQEIWFRGGIYLALIWTIIMFGIYGMAYDTSTFIYFQF